MSATSVKFLWHAYVVPQCFSMRSWKSAQVTVLSEDTPDTITVYRIWRFISDHKTFPVAPDVVRVKV